LALCAAGEKDDAGAEEHGEKATHLAFEEHPLNEEEGKVDVDVGPSESIDWESNRYVMDYFGVAKEIDIHDENTEQGHAA
jgi:outer membrane scaffolding protein for murein synthesis (MipA/OmpV family)